MKELHSWLGSVHELPGLRAEWAVLACTLASVVCGAMIGLEREKRDKPAGLRTVVLIALGSTIFTLVSLLLAGLKPMADPARLASQILPGIGFLGAGAIIRSRGNVVGLTTGATIWAVAAVGVTIGSGFIAAGFAFSLVILIVLTSLQRLEWLVTGRCVFARATIVYRPESGKTRPRLQEIFDRYRVSEATVAHGTRRANEQQVVEAKVCLRHREHRKMLREVAELPEVLALEMEDVPAGTQEAPAT